MAIDAMETEETLRGVAARTGCADEAGLVAEIRSLGRLEALRLYGAVLERGDASEIRWLGRNDRFFLLGCLMMRQDVLEKDWCYERCREVEADPDGWLDLWSRFHYKSTIITLAGSVQEILRDPEMTVGLMSYTKPIAHKFVDQIRRSLEAPELVRLYPDILWDRPPRQGWSTQGGLTVKRRGNPKEPTLMGSGLVDGQPISMHYRLRIYDDVVVRSSVTTPEQLAKTTEMWELSLALGTEDGGREWYAGTRYHPDDTYSAILRRGLIRERRRLCEDADGRPTMMTPEHLERLRASMGANTYAAQMLQNPVAAGVRVFRDEWLCRYSKPPARESMNVYIFVDGAKSKGDGADRTCMWVVGYATDGNNYILDGVRDRLNLTEKTRWIFRLHRKWRPNAVIWEQQGPMSDVEHVLDVQERDSYRFRITPISRGPKDSKRARIESLQANFEEGRIWLPWTLRQQCSDGSVRDIMEEFVEEEYRFYPIVRHDDALDCLADINDHDVKAVVSWPDGAFAEDSGMEDSRAVTSWNPFG